MKTTKKYMLIYDIPKRMNTLRNRIHRRMMKLGVEKMQDSLWVSNDADALTTMAMEIKDAGGNATVMKIEEVLV